MCFFTKAIHLELVSDLLIPIFFAALKKVISHCGKPKIVCDCATTFRKTSKELKEIYMFVSQIVKSYQVSNFIANEGIIWIFNQPAAPHSGGI